jgi:hypothetical protein
MMRNATALACVAVLATGSTIRAQVTSEWTRVSAVANGAELRIETDTTPVAWGRLLSVDDHGITIVKGDGLPRPARRFVAEAAQHHPERLLHSGDEYVENNVRIDRDGVWVGAHLAATRANLIEWIDKPDVREIRYAREGNGGSDGQRDAIIGVVAGGALAYYVGAVLGCGPGAVVSECQGIGTMMMLVGSGAGAAIGYVTGNRTKHPSGVVYRRP